MKSYFITGTDTEVGKTIVTCALMSACQQQSLSAVAIKALAAGAIETDDGLYNEDALMLQRYSSQHYPYETINPVLLPIAASPHVSVYNMNVSVSSHDIATKTQKIIHQIIAPNNHDFLFIEGAGGWHCPINNDDTMADLAKAYGFPVILVVGLKLGCLNHSLLTIEAILDNGLQLAGWVANAIDEDMIARDENINYLKNKIPAPLIASLPYLASSTGSASSSSGPDPELFTEYCDNFFKYNVPPLQSLK